MRKIIAAVTAAVLCAAMVGCGSTESSSDKTSSVQVSSAADSSESKTQGIDYMALVNKLNALPKNWEDSLETVHITNSLGDDVEVEKKAYEAYQKLKADLEKDGVRVDLDSARRSVADQERIMADFTEKYGADYAKKTVATPGYSEHHTGLALDLYLNIDGKDVYLNEDMVKYPEVWAKIHSKLADYGFILRYLEDKEHITGYGYEPWHLRYIDDVKTAKEIMSKGITFEEYLGAVKTYDVSVDYGSSSTFTQDEIKQAAIQVKCKFASFEGCELRSLLYGGDESNTKENLERMNAIDKDKNYVQVIRILTDLHTSEKGYESLEADKDIKDYQWWLAREKDGGWELLVWEK